MGRQFVFKLEFEFEFVFGLGVRPHSQSWLQFEFRLIFKGGFKEEFKCGFQSRMCDEPRWYD